MVRGVVVVCGARCSRMGRGRPWALALHEWGVVGSGRLWAVVVVLGGVAFICVRAVAVVCGRSWLSVCVRSSS